MNWFAGLVMCVIIWWVIFFTTLPFGVRAPHEVGEAVEPGHDGGAPVRPRLGLKAGITTAITAVLWAIAYVIIDYDLISFRPS